MDHSTYNKFMQRYKHLKNKSACIKNIVKSIYLVQNSKRNIKTLAKIHGSLPKLIVHIALNRAVSVHLPQKFCEFVLGQRIMGPRSRQTAVPTLSGVDLKACLTPYLNPEPWQRPRFPSSAEAYPYAKTPVYVLETGNGRPRRIFNY